MKLWGWTVPEYRFKATMLPGEFSLLPGHFCGILLPMKSVNKPINVRRPEVMEKVQAEVAQYRSNLVESIIASGNVYHHGKLQISLAADFGFCDGVKRAIEIAYATCHMFRGKRIWLIGEIIHNPEVNARLDAMGLLHLPWSLSDERYAQLTPEDVVIMPAFGVSVQMRQFLDAKGVQLVDSTCGNVVKVWHRVRNYARRGITSIIHGKVRHEESIATASHSRGDDGNGHFIVIFSEDDAHCVADYIAGKGNKEEFLARFKQSVSPGFDPDVHLLEVGVANQTTMLKDETARIQQIIRAAVELRDGNDERCHLFDTICGATQDRQNALYDLLEKSLDAMFIVGGYNSSNTTHLAHIAAMRLPTFFIKSADCLIDSQHIKCFDLATKSEQIISLPPAVAHSAMQCHIGITAGASCPDNVIEQVITRLTSLRGK